jgi:Leucine-rich repeat (LRR) protein
MAAVRQPRPAGLPPNSPTAAILIYAIVTSSLVQLTSFASALSTSSTAAGCPDGCLCSNSTGHVTCDGSRLESFPVFGRISVTNLDLSRNSIRCLNASTFADVGSGYLGNVIELKLRQNGIECLEPDAFVDRPIARRLQVLDLADNDLTSLQPGVFGPLARLVQLDLSANHLTSVDGLFDGLSDLVRLDLRANRLTAIGSSTFDGLPALRYLRLDDNSISLIDQRAFSRLERLSYLAMKANPLGTGVRFNFRSPFLTYIDMSECQLDRVPRGLPPTVRYLQLRRNRIRKLDARSLADCSRDLNILVLDENELDEIEDGALAPAAGLQQLWLNGNRLRTIPRPLPVGLQKLFVDSNRLDGLVGRDLISVPITSSNSGRSVPLDDDDDNNVDSQLTTVSLMSNNISTISSDAFRKLSRLQSLDLGANRIGRLATGTFSLSNARLRTLSLSNNPIDLIESGAFAGLTDLEALSLSYVTSPDVSVDGDAFVDDMPSLRRLDLDSSPALVRRLLVGSPDSKFISTFRTVRDLAAFGSELDSLPIDFFATRFPDLTVLRMSSARWHCDQRLLWLRNWLLSETTVHIDQPDVNFRCATPPEVADRPLTSLDESKFAPSSFMSSDDVYRTFSRALPRSSSTTQQTMTQPSLRDADEPSAAKATRSSRDQGDGDGDSVPTWEELLNRAPIYQVDGIDNRSTAIVEQSSSNGSFSSNINRRPPSTPLAPVGSKTLGRSVGSLSNDGDGDDDDKEDRGRVVMIALATVFVTILLAAVLLTVIVYLCRKQQIAASRSPSSAKSLYVPSSPSPSSKIQNGRMATAGIGGGSSYGSTSTVNGRSAKHHVQWQDTTAKDVVYFMAANGSCSPKTATSRCGCNGSATSVRAAIVERRRPSTVTTTLIGDETAETAMDGRELIALVPGRDMKHEGPLRVYKWEDF